MICNAMNLLTAERPTCVVAGQPIPLEQLALHESPDPGFTATVRTRVREEPFQAGQNLDVSSQGTSFSGKIVSVAADETPEGGFVMLKATCSNELDRPRTACYRDVKRRELVNKLGPFTGDDGGPNEQHDRLVLVNEPPRSVAMRLALLGGRLAVTCENTIQLVDPTSPSAVKPVRQFMSLRTLCIGAPDITLNAPDPDRWAEQIEHRQPGSHADAPAFGMFLPEAVSLGELKAAAEAISAVEKMGTFSLYGGRALMAIPPGHWIAVKQCELLVTQRVRSWTPTEGWIAELAGGYLWERLEHRPTLAGVAGCVAGYDEKKGLLKVKLAARIEIDAHFRADRVNEKEIASGIPAIGDRGFVSFAMGPEHAIYLGGVVPPGVLKGKDFEELAHTVSSGELKQQLRADGCIEQQAKEYSAKYDRFETQAGKVQWKKR